MSAMAETLTAAATLVYGLALMAGLMALGAALINRDALAAIARSLWMSLRLRARLRATETELANLRRRRPAR